MPAIALDVFRGLQIEYARTSHRLGALGGGLVLPTDFREASDGSVAFDFAPWEADPARRHPDLQPRLPDAPDAWWSRFWHEEIAAAQGGRVTGPMLVAATRVGNYPDRAVLSAASRRFVLDGDVRAWRLPPALLVGQGERYSLREWRRAPHPHGVQEHRPARVSGHRLRIPVEWLARNGPAPDPDRDPLVLIRGFFCRSLGWKQYGARARRQMPFTWTPQGTHVGEIVAHVLAACFEDGALCIDLRAGLRGRPALRMDRLELWNGRDGYALALMLDVLQVPRSWSTRRQIAHVPAERTWFQNKRFSTAVGFETAGMVGLQGLGADIEPLPPDVAEAADRQECCPALPGRLIREIGWKLSVDGDQVAFCYGNRGVYAHAWQAHMHAALTCLEGDGVVAEQAFEGQLCTPASKQLLAAAWNPGRVEIA